MRKIPEDSLYEANGYASPAHHTEARCPEIAPNVLSLPRIDKKIPLVYAEPCDRKLLDLAKSMMTAGCEFEDVEYKPIHQIIHEGINQFIGDIVGDYISELYVEKWDGGKINLSFNFPLDQSPAFMCHDRLKSMQETGKGLVEYALSVLYHSPVPVLTPGDFMTLIEMIEWLGFQDESEYIAEMMSDGETSEEDIDCLRLENVLKVIPQWSLDACHSDPQEMRQKVQIKQLNNEDKKLLSLLDRLMKITQVEMTEAKEGRLYHGYNEFTAIMFMDDASEGGMYFHIIDNVYRGSMESSEHEDNSLFSLIIDPEEDAAKWITLIRQCREVMTLVHSILPLLGEKL